MCRARTRASSQRRVFLRDSFGGYESQSESGGFGRRRPSFPSVDLSLSSLIGPFAKDAGEWTSRWGEADLRKKKNQRNRRRVRRSQEKMRRNDLRNLFNRFLIIIIYALSRMLFDYGRQAGKDFSLTITLPRMSSLALAGLNAVPISGSKRTSGTFYGAFQSF